jgi:hypothetical protein
MERERVRPARRILSKLSECDFQNSARRRRSGLCQACRCFDVRYVAPLAQHRATQSLHAGRLRARDEAILPNSGGMSTYYERCVLTPRGGA